MLKKVSVILLLAVLFSFSWASPVIAEEEEGEDDQQIEEVENEEEGQVLVSPAVVTATALERDSLSFSANIENETDRNYRYYPLVVEIDEEGRKFADEASGLADWVEIDRRRQELGSQESEDLRFRVEVSRDTDPGSYYGAIILAEGSTREDALENALERNFPEILVNIEVDENLIERAQILRFENENSFLPPADFNLKIENIGNVDVAPTGIISIYDQRGKEVETLEVNPDREPIESEVTEVFENDWDEGLGRYKAVLRLDYGEKTQRELLDIIFFWIIPWQVMAIFALGAFAFVVLIWLILNT